MKFILLYIVEIVVHANSQGNMLKSFLFLFDKLLPSMRYEPAIGVLFLPAISAFSQIRIF